MRSQLKKKGSFRLLGASPENPGRCGSTENRTYGYELKLEVETDNLDKDDFVIDHLLIQRFFDETFSKEPWILSCELMGARTVVFFHRLIEQAERTPRFIEIDIIADSVSHICRWESGMDDPEVPTVNSKFANIGNTWERTPNVKKVLGDKVLVTAGGDEEDKDDDSGY